MSGHGQRPKETAEDSSKQQHQHQRGPLTEQARHGNLQHSCAAEAGQIEMRGDALAGRMSQSLTSEAAMCPHRVGAADVASGGVQLRDVGAPPQRLVQVLPRVYVRLHSEAFQSTSSRLGVYVFKSLPGAPMSSFLCVSCKVCPAVQTSTSMSAASCHLLGSCLQAKCAQVSKSNNKPLKAYHRVVLGVPGHRRALCRQLGHQLQRVCGVTQPRLEEVVGQVVPRLHPQWPPLLQSDFQVRQYRAPWHYPARHRRQTCSLCMQLWCG